MSQGRRARPTAGQLRSQPAAPRAASTCFQRLQLVAAGGRGQRWDWAGASGRRIFEPVSLGEGGAPPSLQCRGEPGDLQPESPRPDPDTLTMPVHTQVHTQMRTYTDTRPGSTDGTCTRTHTHRQCQPHTQAPHRGPRAHSRQVAVDAHSHA